MSRIYVGINHRKAGGIAVMDWANGSVTLHPIPGESERGKMREIIKTFISDIDEYKVVLERPIMSPYSVLKPCPVCRHAAKTPVARQGVGASYINYGMIIGMLESYGIPYEEVTSSVWKKALKLTSDKSLSVSTANRLYPKLKDTIKQKDGLADALLIAEYGRRHLYNPKTQK